MLRRLSEVGVGFPEDAARVTFEFWRTCRSRVIFATNGQSLSMIERAVAGFVDGRIHCVENIEIANCEGSHNFDVAVARAK